MKKAKGIAAILSVLVVLPIWFYLFYKVLAAVNASELMWFLYWIYLPVALIASLLTKIAGEE